MNYPRVIQMKNIKPEKRICCVCGKPIPGRGYFFIPSVGRGKYLHYKPWGKSECQMIYEKEHVN